MRRTKKEKKLKINKAYMEAKSDIKRFNTLNRVLGEIYQEWQEKDMVSVVRCKDCKWHDKGKNESEEWSDCILPRRQMISVDDDDFCSYGERIEYERCAE